MARLPRLTAPGFPHHVIQRGNNRQAIFLDRSDYERMLALLAEHAARFKVAVHGYVLMSNHLHLLLTPETADGLPSMMQAVGRSYVQAFNKRHGRTGTLWEGRYRSTLIDSDSYLLACMVYLDLNPVRAGLVAKAADHRWSSHGHYIGVRVDPMVTPHELAWHLGNTPFAREAAYAALVADGIALRQQQALTEAVLKGWALGNEDFLNAVSRLTLRRTVKSRAGRPFQKLRHVRPSPS